MNHGKEKKPNSPTIFYGDYKVRLNSDEVLFPSIQFRSQNWSLCSLMLPPPPPFSIVCLQIHRNFGQLIFGTSGQFRGRPFDGGRGELVRILYQRKSSSWYIICTCIQCICVCVNEWQHYLQFLLCQLFIDLAPNYELLFLNCAFVSLSKKTWKRIFNF